MDLYSVDYRISQCFDGDTGEIFDEEALAKLEMERGEILENLINLRRNLCAEIAGCKSQEEQLAEYRKSKEKRVEQIERWIDKSQNGVPYKSPTGTWEVKYTPSEETIIDNMQALIAWDEFGVYLKFDEPKPDKKAIKKAIKAGENIPGCSILKKSNMKINGG